MSNRHPLRRSVIFVAKEIPDQTTPLRRSVKFVAEGIPDQTTPLRRSVILVLEFIPLGLKIQINIHHDNLYHFFLKKTNILL